MSKWIKGLLLTSGSLLLLGLILLGIGSLTGGVTFFKKQYQANPLTQTTQAIEAFTQLDIDSKLDIKIEKSPDAAYHLGYYEADIAGSKRQPINLDYNNGKLTLTDNPDYITLHIGWLYHSNQKTFEHTDAQDFLTGLGVLRQTLEENLDFMTVTLYVPEGVTLTQVTSHTGLTLANQTVTDLNITVDSGDLLLSDSSVQKAKLSLDMGDLKVQRSQLQELTVTSDFGDVELVGSHIANSQMNLDNGDLNSQATSFSGQNTIKSSFGDVEIALTPEQRDQLNYVIHADFGEISLSSDFKTTLQASGASFGESNEETTSLTRQQEGKVGQLNVTVDNGNVNFK